MVRYICSVLLAVLFFQAAPAQPTLTFKRVEVQYPKIRLAYKVTCNGQFATNVTPQHFEVYENGLLVKDATLWCPPDPDCCVSVALVLDRSGSMAGEKLDRVKGGAAAFVAQMNPDGQPCDEAAIVSFAEDVTLDMKMTTHKGQLLGAINAMESFGWTAVWDATAVGIQELANSGKNRCKAVVVLTDGGDNRSQYFLTVQAVMRFAQLQGVKVYTIGYGLEQGGPEESNLQLLAQGTGGQYYYSADGTDLATIYASIKQSVKEAFQECYIDYESTCPDGTIRTVELRLKNFCGGNAVATRTYVAPLDRNAFKSVRFRAGDADVGATREVIVPITLETAVNEVFSKSDVTIGYDRNLMQLLNVSTTGTILDGRAVTYQHAGSAVIVHIEEHIPMNQQPGVLFYLHFRTADVSSMTYASVQILDWAFQAYCLYPETMHGLVRIRPREPILDCYASVPGSLNWNDQDKRYEPNPFDVSVTVTNSGTREARNVRAFLVVDTNIVKFVTPQTPAQLLSPSVIQPGASVTATWTLLAVKQKDLDSIGIYFSVMADSYAPFACWSRVLIDPALSSAIACDISAPDTVYFREQYYEPEEFDITVRALNVGNGQARDVRAQLLQDTRFTIIPPASRPLADVLLPGASAEGQFRVRINPRDTDGYDTIRVNIQGDDTNPAWCYHPVWVQRVRAPRFSLLCSTPEDSLIFSDANYNYVPNPFVVTTVGENIGETYAEECQLMFMGPEYFTPVGSNLRPLGTMQIGETRSEQWTITALPRTTGGWDTLRFQIIGRGGLGKQIALAECTLPVYVPAVRRPEYRLECSAPDSLGFVNNAYTPEPVLTVRITNVGNAAGRGLYPTIALPPLVSLADGERPHRYVPVLQPGESIELQWKLVAEARAYDGSYRLCAQVLDSIGVTAQCCSDIFIPKTEYPVLMPSCWAIDSLFIDSESGAYLGNPFEVVLNLTNVGLGKADRVRASIAVLGSFMKLLDPAEQIVGDLEVGGTARLRWNVQALKRPDDANIPIVITIMADNHETRECSLAVHVPAAREPVLQVRCESIPADSILFDWNTGDFAPPVGTLRFTVTNVGTVKAIDVDALLVVPSGINLASGELPQKRLAPPDLAPGESAVVTWTFRPVRSDEDFVRDFRFVARASNAADAECVHALFVQGSPRHLTITVPNDVLLRFGQKMELPLRIDRTVGKDLSEYVLRFEYDPAILSVLGTVNAGTLTALGWVGAKLSPLSPGVVEISDYTTGTPIATDAGVLVKLYVEGVFNDKSSITNFGRCELRIDTTATVLNRGVIHAHAINGSAIVTNDCLEPLQATERFVLEQNRPNPFNPSTVIRFTLAAEVPTRLLVYDVHGRPVRTLLDELLPRGSHSVTFTAGDLPSGVYFYRLETPRHSEVRTMLLAR